MTTKKILALISKKHAQNVQVLSLANFLSKGGEFYTKQIIFNNLIKLPNWIFRFLPIWLTVNKNEGFNDIEECDIIVTYGSRTSRYARHLKKYIFPNVKIIQISNPEYFAKNVDLVLVPEHQKTLMKNNKKLIPFKGFLCDQKTEDFYKSEEEKFKNIKDIFNESSRFISVYIGSSSQHYNLSDHHLDELCRRINLISNNMQIPLLIVASKKITTEQIQRVRNQLNCKYYLHEVGLDKKAENPYYAFMSMSTYNITTSDSIAAIAELSSTKKPLYLFTDGINSKKYNHFINDLIFKSSARELTRDTFELSEFETKQLNNLEELTNEIFIKLGF